MTTLPPCVHPSILVATAQQQKKNRILIIPVVMTIIMMMVMISFADGIVDGIYLVMDDIFDMI